MKESNAYEIVIKAAETGSFSKTAEVLNYTQSGISQAIREVEKELGIQLFVRVRQGVELTDNGKRVLPYMQEILNQKENLYQVSYEINNKVVGKLRIGSFSSVTAMWMSDCIRWFEENYPDVHIEILDGNYDQILDWLIHGQLDCGFLSSISVEGFKFYPLYKDPLYAVVCKGHPLSSKKKVTLKDVCNYPFVAEAPGCGNDIERLLQKEKITPDVRYSFQDDFLIMSFVRNKIGVTISQGLVLEATPYPGVIPIKLSPAYERTIGVCFAHSSMTLVEKIFLDYIQKYCHKKQMMKKS